MKKKVELNYNAIDQELLNQHTHAHTASNITTMQRSRLELLPRFFFFSSFLLPTRSLAFIVYFCSSILLEFCAGGRKIGEGLLWKIDRLSRTYTTCQRIARRASSPLEKDELNCARVSTNWKKKGNVICHCRLMYEGCSWVFFFLLSVRRLVCANKKKRVFAWNLFFDHFTVSYWIGWILKPKALEYFSNRSFILRIFSLTSY